MRQIKKSVHSGYIVAKQATQRYAKMYFRSRLQDGILATTIQTTVKSDPGVQVIMHMDARITSFKQDKVKPVNGKHGLQTDVG